MARDWAQVTAREFAHLVGRSESTLTAWLDEGLPHVGARGQGRVVRIPLREGLQWALNRREPKGSERERLAAEQADKVALENATKRGELVHAHHVRETLNWLAAEVAARLDALPGRMASELAGISEPAVIRQRLLDECRGVRAAVADAWAERVDAGRRGGGGAVDPAPAEEADAESVGRRKPRAPARKRRARAVQK